MAAAAASQAGGSGRSAPPSPAPAAPPAAPKLPGCALYGTVIGAGGLACPVQEVGIIRGGWSVNVMPSRPRSTTARAITSMGAALSVENSEWMWLSYFKYIIEPPYSGKIVMVFWSLI